LSSLPFRYDLRPDDDDDDDDHLQAIVLQFGEEIEGIAGMIIQQLLATFESYSLAGEDDDEAAFGATECLETITTVLEVVKENSTAVGAVEEMLTPLLYKIFSTDDMIEYIENGIQIISYLTYYPDNINSVRIPPPPSLSPPPLF
jgi:importin-7